MNAENFAHHIIQASDRDPGKSINSITSKTLKLHFIDHQGHAEGGLLGHLARAPSFEEGPLSRQKITSIVFSNLSSKVPKLP